MLQRSNLNEFVHSCKLVDVLGNVKLKRNTGRVQRNLTS